MRSIELEPLARAGASGRTMPFLDPPTRLALAARRGQLLLTLGAGASADVEVPVWEELVRIVAGRCQIGDQGRTRLIGMEPTQAFESLLDSPSAWQALQDVLYDSRLRRGEADWAARGLEDRWVLDKGIFILAVLAIVLAWLKPSRAIHVVTYNLESLLEEMIAALGHEALAIVGSRSRTWKPNTEPRVLDRRRPARPRAEVRVYHPHGLILRPQTCSSDDLGWRKKRVAVAGGTVELPDGFRHPVMCASQYKELRDEALGERNLLQLHSFAHDRILFYGFSLEDANVDYLVDLASRITQGPSRLQEDPGLVPTTELRHIALLRGDESCQVPMPTGPEEVDIPSAEWRRRMELAARGIQVRGFWSYDQHRAFVFEILRQLNRGNRFRWPGQPDLRPRPRSLDDDRGPG